MVSSLPGAAEALFSKMRNVRHLPAEDKVLPMKP
jgi:hypothetical protein